MQSLDVWKKKIQDTHTKVSYREFLKLYASWKPFGFYKNQGMISRYPDVGRVKNIVTPKQFLELRDSLPFIEYDASKTFFSNLQSLFDLVPLASLVHFHKNENVDFADCVFAAKNVYLSTVIGSNSENVYYSAFSYIHISNIFNSLLVSKNCHNIYSCVFIGNSFQIFYSKFIQNSSDIWFSTNLVGCRECVFCDGLENASYCIANKKFEKEEYLKQKQIILARKNDFQMYFSKLPAKAINYNSKQVTGNAIYFCENVENGAYNQYLKNGRNVVFANGDQGCEDFYNCIDVGINSNNFYGVCSAGETGANHIYFSCEVGISSNIFYSYHIENSSNCIGCIGLRNKHFCIFNKQYTKEEWYLLADILFTSLEKEGKLGDFFPASMNPFYFNDTMAYMLDKNFMKGEVEKDGYLWRQDKIKVDIPQNADTVTIDKLQDFQKTDASGKWYIDESIVTKVIQDIEGNYYRIIKEELDFLNKYGLPLPQLHWFARMQENINSL